MVEEQNRPPTSERRGLTVTIDFTGVLILLAVASFGLIAAGVIVGLVRGTLDLTAVVPVLATMFSGLVAGILVSRKSGGGGGGGGA